MVCTFFGHREIHNSDEVVAKLNNTIVCLIEKGVREFLVGCNGNFDRLVLLTLRDLSKTYDIDYKVVLAYLNNSKNECFSYKTGETLFPEDMERCPYRYAIDKRNRWMIKKSKIVVTYINTPFGGSYKYAEICEKKELEIIRLGKM